MSTYAQPNGLSEYHSKFDLYLSYLKSEKSIKKMLLLKTLVQVRM